MPEETIDPGLLEQTKTQIRKLVAEIAELAESDIQPNEFYGEFLNRAVAAVAASGGALWLLDGKGGMKLQQQLEFRLTGLLDGRVRTQPHDALLGCMIQASQATIIPPGAAVEGVPNAGNPTGFSLIIAPLTVDKQVVGLVEILMDPTRRAAQQKSTLRFVGDLCDLAGQYLKNRQMRQMMSQQRLWNQLETFTHAIHGSLDLKEACFAVANDGKRLVACDRLSVALKVGGRTMIEAVSGQEVVEQRANLIRELTRLCKAVIRSGEDLVYTGNTEGFAPDLRDALESYVDESGSKAVIVTLLHKPETDATKDKVAFGCLVAEQIGDEMAPTDAHARCEVVSRHASTALWNASEYDKASPAGPQADRLPLAVLPRADPGQDHRRAGRPDQPDPDPDLRPLAADDRRQGLAPARRPAQPLRPGRRDRPQRPGRARPVRQGRRGRLRAREQGAGEGEDQALRRDAARPSRRPPAWPASSSPTPPAATTRRSRSGPSRPRPRSRQAAPRSR